MNIRKEFDLKDWLEYEDIFKKEIENLNIQIEKLWQFDKFDFKVWNNIYVEVKKRNCSVNTYTTTKINMKKYIEALDRVCKWDSCYLVIKWEDFVGYINFLETPPVQTSYELWRKDRGCIEKSYYSFFDVSKFKEYNPIIFSPKGI